MCRYDESEHSGAISCCGDQCIGLQDTTGDPPYKPEGTTDASKPFTYMPVTMPVASDLDGPMFAQTEDAIKVLKELFAHALGTFRRKNRGYADTDRSCDVLKNFREEAADEGISMLRYARIMRNKHEKAWRTFVMTGSTSDKPWRILKDRLVYTLIEYLIALDRGDWSHEEVLQDIQEGS